MTACSVVCEHFGLKFPGNRCDGNLQSNSVGLYKLRNNFKLPILGKMFQDRRFNNGRTLFRSNTKLMRDVFMRHYVTMPYVIN